MYREIFCSFAIYQHSKFNFTRPAPIKNFNICRVSSFVSNQWYENPIIFLLNTFQINAYEFKPNFEYLLAKIIFKDNNAMLLFLTSTFYIMQYVLFIWVPHFTQICNHIAVYVTQVADYIIIFFYNTCVFNVCHNRFVGNGKSHEFFRVNF